MNRETVRSLFSLFSKENSDDYQPLVSAAVAEVEGALRPDADKSDVRLCYLAAALANLRYTAILWARGREAATYAGNLPGASDGAQEYAFALRLVQAYKGMCAELIEDRGFLFTGIREAADEGAV